MKDCFVHQKKSFGHIQNEFKSQEVSKMLIKTKNFGEFLEPPQKMGEKYHTQVIQTVTSYFLVGCHLPL